MDIYPAIDIRNGRAVRLSRGEADAETVYHPDPVALAERFVWQGARWIHLVDLDQAFGDGDNLRIIERLVTRVGSHVQVQLGGGFRRIEDIRRGLDQPVARLVLGTAAVETPELVAQAVEVGGSARIAVSLDTRDGLVTHHGWTETSTQSARDVGQRVAAHGVRTLIYTDVARDGMLSGADVPGAADLQRHSGCRVLLSGGIAGIEDIQEGARQGLAGVIVGRALYEHRFTLSEALAASSPAASRPV